MYETGALGRNCERTCDLIQIHAVNAWADLEQALAPDGAVAALEEARQQGLTRFIGVTGHARPDILGHTLTQYAFDTVLVALGMADLVAARKNVLLPIAQDREVGVIAMKDLGMGSSRAWIWRCATCAGLTGCLWRLWGWTFLCKSNRSWRLRPTSSPSREEEEARLIEEVRVLVEQDPRKASRARAPSSGCTIPLWDGNRKMNRPW